MVASGWVGTLKAHRTPRLVWARLIAWFDFLGMERDSQVFLLLERKSHQNVHLLLQTQHRQFGEGRKFTLCQNKWEMQHHGVGAWYTQGMMMSAQNWCCLGWVWRDPQGCRAALAASMQPRVSSSGSWSQHLVQVSFQCKLPVLARGCEVKLLALAWPRLARSPQMRGGAAGTIPIVTQPLIKVRVQWCELCLLFARPGSAQQLDGPELRLTSCLCPSCCVLGAGGRRGSKNAGLWDRGS